MGKSFAEQVINEYMRFGATWVTEEQYQERLATCRICPKLGMVKIPGATVQGCTVCGCPSSTKPKVLKYFHPRKLRVVTVKCDLDKWPALSK